MTRAVNSLAMTLALAIAAWALTVGPLADLRDRLSGAVIHGTGPNCPARDPAHLGVCWPHEVTK